MRKIWEWSCVYLVAGLGLLVYILKFLSIVIHGMALHGLTPTYYGLRDSLKKTVSKSALISLKQKTKTLLFQAYRYWLQAGSLLEFSQMSFNLSFLSFQISECPISISLSHF